MQNNFKGVDMLMESVTCILEVIAKNYICSWIHDLPQGSLRHREFLFNPKTSSNYEPFQSLLIPQRYSIDLSDFFNIQIFKQILEKSYYVFF